MNTNSFAIQRNGFDGLERINREVPVPRAKEVLLRVRAMGLNYRDVEILLGTYHSASKFPLVPLSDCVAEVIEAGQEVTRVKKGDRVVVAFWEHWTDGDFDPAEFGTSLGGPNDGVLTEIFRTTEDRLVLIPQQISDIQAASLPCAATTAWNALVTAGRIKSGDSVLVQGTGGVSLFALQFARIAGARVIVTSSSDAKLERAVEMGAFGTVNYQRSPEWSRHVLELTDGRGVDHVLEVGGPGSFAQSLKSVRFGGQINLIGYLGGVHGAINPMDIFWRQATVRCIAVGSRAMLEQLVRAIGVNQVAPVIDKVFAWTDAAAALRHLHSGSHFGKVVLSV